MLATLALLGIYLIEPFYDKTIEKNATQSILKKFYKNLHRTWKSLGEEGAGGVHNQHYLAREYMELFCGVKKTYGEEDVMETVMEVASESRTEAAYLTNLVIPELRTVLAREGTAGLMRSPSLWSIQWSSRQPM